MDEYREGKVKSPPARGVKESLKPFAYRQPEGADRLVPLGSQRGRPDGVPIEE